jgi:hypothetical protein
VSTSSASGPPAEDSPSQQTPGTAPVGALPRDIGFKFRVAEDVKNPRFEFTSERGVRLFDDTREIALLDVHAQTYMNRKEGSRPPKVLTSVPVAPEGALRHSDELLQTFSRVYAVDTGTKVIDGIRVSVTAAARFHIPKDYRTTPVWEEYRPVFEVHGLKEDPERHGWEWFIANEIVWVPLVIGERVAIITDAKRDLLPAINQRMIPLNEKQELPRGFTMLYASQDSGFASVMSYAIKVVDRCVRMVFSQIEAGATYPPLIRHRPFSYCRSSRTWKAPPPARSEFSRPSHPPKDV